MNDYQEEIEILDKIIKMHPKDKILVSALILRENALCDLGNLQEGIKYFDKALEIDPENKISFENRKNTMDELNS